MACGCSTKKPTAASSGTSARFVRTTPLLPRAATFRDTDGSELQQLDPNDPGAGPVVREPVPADGNGPAPVDGGGVVFTDGTNVDAHTSPLGQALASWARNFTGGRP